MSNLKQNAQQYKTRVDDSDVPIFYVDAGPAQVTESRADQTPEPTSRANEDVMDLTRKFFGG